MHTGHVSILLPDYIRGTLIGGEATRVEEHLRTCQSCRAEAEELRSVFLSLEQEITANVPKTYFTSILPRVHERLDSRGVSRRHLNPVVSKVLMPLGAAAVLAALLWRVPFFSNPSNVENPLLSAVRSSTPDEIAEIVQDDIPSQDWNLLNSTIISHALTDERFIGHQLVREALGSETTSPFSVFADVSPQQVLTDLDDLQTDLILKRLGTMEIL